MSNETHQDAVSRQDRVIVIGAGFVGVATAIWLQREGHEVTLIDKGGPEERASFGNAGVLASSSVVPVTTPGLLGKAPGMVLDKNEPIFLQWSYLLKLLPWAVRYLAHANEADARRIAAALTPIIGNSLEDHRALAAGTGAEPRIRACDFSVLFKNREAFLNDPLPWDIRRANGFSWSEREGVARTEYEPALDPAFEFMAILGGHGQINDPGAYLGDLIKHFVSAGGVLRLEEVSDIVQQHGKVTGVRSKGEFLPASVVAITAGAWSPLLTRKLGVSIPLEAESGYHVEYWGASKMPVSPTLVPGYKFILTPMDGRLRVAGSVEFGGLENKGREQPWNLIKAGVKTLLPGLTYERESRWIGHRPAPTDSVPVIDELPTVSGVFVGCGHQHVGLTGSARTGQLLASMIAGRPIDIDMKAYRIDRFAAPGNCLSQWRQSRIKSMEAH